MLYLKMYFETVTPFRIYRSIYLVKHQESILPKFSSHLYLFLDVNVFLVDGWWQQYAYKENEILLNERGQRELMRLMVDVCSLFIYPISLDIGVWPYAQGRSISPSFVYHFPHVGEITNWVSVHMDNPTIGNNSYHMEPAIIRWVPCFQPLDCPYRQSG